MLALGLLQVAVSSSAAANRAGGLLSAVAKTIDHVISPTVPAIPDLRKHGGAAPPRAAVDTTPNTGGTGGSLLPADWSTSASALYV